VSTLEELAEVLAEGVELVLLDNFTPAQCAEAVRMTRELSPKTELEASGGLTLEVAGEYASTGVHYLAVGGLTHSAPALDIGLDMGSPVLRWPGALRPRPCRILLGLSAPSGGCRNARPPQHGVVRSAERPGPGPQTVRPDLRTARRSGVHGSRSP